MKRLKIDRRRLDFRTFPELAGELRSLRGVSYDRAGKWSLGQVCRHLNNAISQSVDGFDIHVPWVIRLFAPIALKVTLKKRSMPAGFKGPSEWAPGEGEDDATELDALLQTIGRYESHGGALHPSPLFGALTRGQWDQLHLIHAAHHLGFISPRG